MWIEGNYKWVNGIMTLFCFLMWIPHTTSQNICAHFIDYVTLVYMVDLFDLLNVAVVLDLGPFVIIKLQVVALKRKFNTCISCGAKTVKK